ncbi:M57 family metalloprotease, partial [Sphingobacterium daejeonense]
LCAIAILLLLFYSCQKEMLVDQEKENIENQIKEIIKLGFKRENIVELKESFLVEGCYYFPKESKTEIENQPNENPKKGQFRTTNIISSSVKTVKIYMDSSIPTTVEDNWRTALNTAISAYNNIANINIRLSLTTLSSDANITIKSDANALPDTTLADAQLPAKDFLSGKYIPGKVLRINLDFRNNRPLSEGNKIYILMHELGHCLGLKHTNYLSENNQSGGVFIPQTPQNDLSSVMYSGFWGQSFPTQSFTPGDLTALRYLFPVKTVISGPQKICTQGTYSIINPGVISILKGSHLANLSQTGQNSWTLTSRGIGSGEIILRSTNNNYLYPTTDYHIVLGLDVLRDIYCSQLGTSTKMAPRNEYDLQINPSVNESYLWAIEGAQILSGQGTSSVKIRVSDQIDPYDPNVRVNLKITDPCTTGFINNSYSVEYGPIDIN